MRSKRPRRNATAPRASIHEALTKARAEQQLLRQASVDASPRLCSQGSNAELAAAQEMIQTADIVRELADTINAQSGTDGIEGSQMSLPETGLEAPAEPEILAAIEPTQPDEVPLPFEADRPSRCRTTPGSR
ncbi:hypothetical protein [Bradyrhizobium genosp. P]|uniref:hypothetical protein n=1 Tax=Bradyrhizobium genosp. P TaxID=83641 RepID=UPI003CF7AAE7